MATLGSTAEPTTTQVWYGLNGVNHVSIALTMPAGGPWNITGLGAWLAGMNETTDVKLCLWSSGGSLLRSGPTRNLAGLPLALGNNIKVEDSITPYEIPGGASVHVGFARDPQDNTQMGTRSGTRKEWASGSWPTSFGAWSSVSGAIGAWLEYESANVAPNVPVNLNPTGNQVLHSGIAPTLNGLRSDSDAGDYIEQYQVVVYADDGVTVVHNPGPVNPGGSPVTFAHVASLPSAHAWYRWKARTMDKGGLWGPYSALQRFYANGVPSTPGAPTVESDTLTPRIDGNFVDPGDTLAAVQIEVKLDESPYPTVWASGDIAKSGASGSAWNQTYAGSPLSWNTRYAFRYRTKDSHGAYSSWSGWGYATLVQPTGPTNNTPRTTTPRLSSLTPTLTVGHSVQFRNEEIKVAASPALGDLGTVLWYKTWDGSDYAATTSKARVYAGSALAYGGTYWWQSRVELTDGTISAWSAWHPIRINADPNSPTGLFPSGGVVVSDTTPQLLMRFADPDLDQGDTPSLVTLEVRNNATDALVFSQTAVAPAPGTSEAGQPYDHIVSPSALTNDVTYKWRARFTDAMGRQGPFSAYQLFKVSQPPSAAGTSPVGGAAVSESTPTLDWTFSSPGGKAQHSYRVKVFDKGPVGANYADEVEVHDSGAVVSSATQYDLPFGVLVDDHDYRWQVTVVDTDLLEFTLA